MAVQETLIFGFTLTSFVTKVLFQENA